MTQGYDFARELARYGPNGSEPPPNPREARAYCHWLTRVHYENFSVVSWFLPRRLIPDFEAVYAFCRWSDDLGDEMGDPERAQAALGWWRSQLDHSWDDPGAAKHPVFVALAESRKEHSLSREPFQRLISAFQRDQVQNRYETRSDLVSYCHDSADPVGEIVLTLFGKATPQTIALSDSICTGLQLANFWQDLSRDLDIGRIYLPREDRVRHGVEEADLRRRVATPAIRALVKDEVEWARSFFESGSSLPSRVGGSLGAQIGLFLDGGKAILAKIETEGFRSLEKRPSLSRWEKGWLALGGLWGYLLGRWNDPWLGGSRVSGSTGLGAKP